MSTRKVIVSVVWSRAIFPVIAALPPESKSTAPYVCANVIPDIVEERELEPRAEIAIRFSFCAISHVNTEEALVSTVLVALTRASITFAIQAKLRFATDASS
jgi:hypothetical protein